MLNLRGEISKSAEWDSFFGRILRVSVALSHVRDDHLRISFGSKSTRLEEGLLVPNTARVHIETCLDVVNGIYHEIDSFPKIVIKNVLRLMCHIELLIFDIQIRVDVLCNMAGNSALRVSNVVFSE